MDGKNKYPCAVCKSQHKKCSEDCIFRPYLPGDKLDLFRLLRLNYGTDQLRKILEGSPEHDRSNTFRELIDRVKAIQEPKIDSPSLITQRQKIYLSSDIIQQQNDVVADADRFFDISMQFQQEQEQELKQQINSLILSLESDRQQQRKETKKLNMKLDMVNMKMDMLSLKMDKLLTGTTSNSCIGDATPDSLDWESIINWEMQTSSKANSFVGAAPADSPLKESPAHPISGPAPANSFLGKAPDDFLIASQTLGTWPGQASSSQNPSDMLESQMSFDMHF